MSNSLSIAIRRTGLVLAATAVAAVVTGSALAVDRPAASFLTKKQIEAISQSWAARGGVFTRPASTPLTPVVGSGFDWGDFGIGAAAMFGLVLLGTGLAAGAHYSRRGGTVRPAS